MPGANACGQSRYIRFSERLGPKAPVSIQAAESGEGASTLAERQALILRKNRGFVPWTLQYRRRISYRYTPCDKDTEATAYPRRAEAIVTHPALVFLVTQDGYSPRTHKRQLKNLPLLVRISPCWLLTPLLPTES
jgi:hypothetical protein